jgi:hypothetical protein
MPCDPRYDILFEAVRIRTAVGPRRRLNHSPAFRDTEAKALEVLTRQFQKRGAALHARALGALAMRPVAHRAARVIRSTLGLDAVTSA